MYFILTQKYSVGIGNIILYGRYARNATAILMRFNYLNKSHRHVDIISLLCNVGGYRRDVECKRKKKSLTVDKKKFKKKKYESSNHSVFVLKIFVLGS